MLKVSRILVIALGLASAGVGITGCGQRGSLYMPTEPAAANRATLPDLLVPGSRKPTDTAQTPAPSPSPSTEPAPASGASAPVTTTVEPAK